MIRKSNPRDSQKESPIVETAKTRLTPQGRRRSIQETPRRARVSRTMKDVTETIGYLWLTISLRQSSQSERLKNGGIHFC